MDYFKQKDACLSGLLFQERCRVHGCKTEERGVFWFQAVLCRAVVRGLPTLRVCDIVPCFNGGICLQMATWLSFYPPTGRRD